MASMALLVANTLRCWPARAATVLTNLDFPDPLGPVRRHGHFWKYERHANDKSYGWKRQSRLTALRHSLITRINATVDLCHCYISAAVSKNAQSTVRWRKLFREVYETYLDVVACQTYKNRLDTSTFKGTELRHWGIFSDTSELSRGYTDGSKVKT